MSESSQLAIPHQYFTLNEKIRNCPISSVYYNENDQDVTEILIKIREDTSEETLRQFGEWLKSTPQHPVELYCERIFPESILQPEAFRSLSSLIIVEADHMIVHNNFPSLLNALRGNTSLKQLSFKGCGIGQIGNDSKVGQLTDALHDNTTLELLNLSCNGLTVNDLEKLDAFLQKNTTLKTLNLAYNLFGSPVRVGSIHAVQILANIIATSNLADLNLIDTSTTHKDLETLAKALPSTKLHVLYLGSEIQETRFLENPNEHHLTVDSEEAIALAKEKLEEGASQNLNLIMVHYSYPDTGTINFAEGNLIYVVNRARERALIDDSPITMTPELERSLNAILAVMHYNYDSIEGKEEFFFAREYWEATSSRWECPGCYNPEAAKELEDFIKERKNNTPQSLLSNVTEASQANHIRKRTRSNDTEEGGHQQQDDSQGSSAGDATRRRTR